jgi:hypothetical protein
MAKVNKKSDTVNDQITAKQEEAKASVPGPTEGLVPGRKYYVRGPRNAYVGRLVAVTGQYTVALAEAAWVADSGRLHQFLLTGNGGERMEIEPCGNVPQVQVQDVFDWPHDLFGDPV